MILKVSNMILIIFDTTKINTETPNPKKKHVIPSNKMELGNYRATKVLESTTTENKTFSG